jgi:cytochrome c oxidase subunit 1
MSYLSAIPATAVTAFGVIGQVYHSGMQWRFTPLALFLGIIGWIIGGFAAVVDSTIAVNVTFHNTLWVPAHFHTYFLAGFFLMLWGFLYDFSGSVRETLAKTGLWLIVAGAYGFFLMFYWGGVLGVPRRFSDYTSVPIASMEASGERAALLASASIMVVIVGLLCVFTTIYTGPGTWSLSTKAAE